MATIRYSSWNGVVKRAIHVDSANPYQFVHQTTQVYPEGFAEANRMLGEDQKGDMKLIARGVPVAVWEQSEREGWDEKRWAQWLNDPDNRAFRVWPGRV